MTIKEVELLTGMTRANIRFYEAEGLLTPVRSENGYRDYSVSDVGLLQKIKLLRLLQIPLDEIKALQQGRKSLHSTLEKHNRLLVERQEELEHAHRICLQMQRDGIQYETMNAVYYLQLLTQKEAGQVLEHDKLPRVCAPWRRYLARALDLIVYGVLWFAIGVLVLREPPYYEGLSGVMRVTAIGLMLVLEPLQLHFFGTTVGKWLLGLYVTDLEDQRLTFMEAMHRTFWAFFKGMGFCLPIYEIIRLYESYDACIQGKELPWEEQSLLVLRNTCPWRWLVCAASIICTVVLTFLAAMPPHRGALTVREFAQNYNDMVNYYGGSASCRLNGIGAWEGVWTPDTVWYDAQPELELTEKDGIVTKVTILLSGENLNQVLRDPVRQEMELITLAFVCAQPEYSPFADKRLLLMQLNPWKDFTVIQHGVRLTAQLEYSGFQTDGYALTPVEGKENSFRLMFSAELVS